MNRIEIHITAVTAAVKSCEEDDCDVDIRQPKGRGWIWWHEVHDAAGCWTSVEFIRVLDDHGEPIEIFKHGYYPFDFQGFSDVREKSPQLTAEEQKKLEEDFGCK